MFTTTAASAGVRIAGLVLVLVAAAAIGLAAGNFINDAAERGPRTIAGYPIGWNGGAGIPVSQTATALFSQSALDSVKVTRGDVAALEVPAVESDYHDRHPQLRSEAGESDYHDRHPQEQAADPLPGIPWSEDPRR